MQTFWKTWDEGWCDQTISKNLTSPLSVLLIFTGLLKNQNGMLNAWQRIWRKIVMSNQAFGIIITVCPIKKLFSLSLTWKSYFPTMHPTIHKPHPLYRLHLADEKCEENGGGSKNLKRKRTWLMKLTKLNIRPEFVAWNSGSKNTFASPMRSGNIFGSSGWFWKYQLSY